MAEPKIIAVAGATGAQGGGLVRAIQRDTNGGFRARALTRDPNSASATELARIGAEVVAADIDDPASLERAFAGAYGAYCVTFFWNHMSPERELVEAKAMAVAAKRANVQHVIWSTLEDVREFVPLSEDHMPTLRGKYKVPHFDAKGEADHFFSDQGVPTTRLLASFYWENLIFFGSGPKKQPDGTLVFSIPLADGALAGIAAEDIGKCAYGILKRGKQYIGKAVGVAGEHLTGTQMAAKMSQALGQEVRYQPLSWAAFRALGFPGADDLGNMFQFYVEFEAAVNGTRDVAVSRSLNPELQTFDQWLAANAKRIPLE